MVAMKDVAPQGQLSGLVETSRRSGFWGEGPGLKVLVAEAG